MTTEHDSGPIRSLELLWGVRERPSRGPKPGLSVERIVRTAVGIADTEGLGAVSMQRVAAELGYTTMALYRYVPGKEQLVDLMMDMPVDPEDEPPDMDGVPGGWRAQVEHWVAGIWGLYRRHPWVLQVPIAGPPAGPGQLGWFEALLRALSRSGLTGAEMIATGTFLTGVVMNLARLSRDITQHQQGAGVTQEGADAAYNQALERFVDADRFPVLAGLVAEGMFQPTEEYDTSIVPDLQFGLERLLDGIEALVASRAGQPDGAEARNGDETPVCATCGNEVPRAATGRPRDYCSRACQQRAYRSRRTSG